MCLCCACAGTVTVLCLCCGCAVTVLWLCCGWAVLWLCCGCRYDVDSKTWISLAPLPTERFGIAAGTLLGYVYVVAGSGIEVGAKPTGALSLQAGGAAGAGAKNVCSLNLVERYDPVANKWEEVAKCSATRAGLAAAVLNEHLYVVGGASDALFGSVILSSAEKYNPRDNTWRSISPMNTKRAGLSVAAVDGHLYAIGGYDQNVKCLNSVERYVCDSASRDIAALPHCRVRVSVAALRGGVRSPVAYARPQHLGQDVGAELAAVPQCRDHAAVP